MDVFNKRQLVSICRSRLIYNMNFNRIPMGGEDVKNITASK